MCFCVHVRYVCLLIDIDPCSCVCAVCGDACYQMRLVVSLCVYTGNH